jgi:hypothetical protein
LTAKTEPTTLPLPFAERVFPNPFGPLVGQPLDDHQVDIAEINSGASEACQRLIQDVKEGGFSAALTVFGDTSTGKTHLIGRVRRWLETQPGNLFVFVRMETSPAGIWRHLRRCVALSLLHTGADGIRAVDRLLGHRKSDLEMLANRDLSVVLEHLLEGRQVRDSSAWLRGEGLPDEVLNSLRLGVPGPEDDPEAISRHIVTSICELIRPGVVVFCMDQIEAVRSSTDDRDGPHAVGKVVSSLIDETHNASVICCQQSSFVNLMEQILEGAAKSRVLGRRAAIQPLSWSQAQQLIGARLNTVPELAAERAPHCGCWPLVESQIRGVFVDDAAPARKVIARCKDLFDLWRSGQATPVEPLDTALQNMLEERFTAKDPSATEAILRNGMPLLARATGLKCSVPGGRSPLDFTIDGGRVAAAICNQANTRTLANHVKKISDAWKPGANQTLLLLRDARLPIPRTAKVTHQRLAGIQSQGGRLVTVSQEALEALAALRRLLSDAESGDLAHHGEPVTPGAVERWIAGHLPSALDPLLSEFGGTPAEPVPPASDRIASALAALLAEQKMVTLEDAARSLEVPPGEVETCARRDPRQFGILGGSAPALFQPITASDAH